MVLLYNKERCLYLEILGGWVVKKIVYFIYLKNLKYYFFKYKLYYLNKKFLNVLVL